MFYRIVVILLLAFSSVSATAQVLRGSLTDENGRPVPAATVYLRELQLGTAADDKGEFALNVKSGTYTYIIHCLGYQTVRDVVEVSASGAMLNVRLSTKTYELPPVIISKNREDPAYRVMRHAIAMAPYYTHQVSSYTADVYLKGTARVTKISRVVKAVAKKQLRGANIKEGEAYFLESMNEISFTAPNNYSHRVLSSNSTLPADFGGNFNTMNFVNVNIYSLNLFTRDAFSNYRFSLEGYTEEGDMYINKIKVTPRKKTPGLVSGYIYIIENTWQVYNADLRGDVPFGSFHAIMGTNEVQKGVRLPTSYSLSAKVNALGNEANFEYAGTVRYKNVKEDKALENPLQKPNAKPVPMPQQTVAQKAAPQKTKADSAKMEKRRKELEQLLEKDNLSNREMMKASKLIAEEADERRPQSLNLSTAYKVQIDSGVRSRDTSYWNAIRPIPLKRDEARSFRKADSVRTIEALPADSVHHRGGWLGNLLLGKRYEPSKTLRITHNGLVAPTMLYFNAVDGWKYGQELGLRKMLADSTTLHLNGAAWWAFNREAFMWKLSGSYNYLPERRASVFFEVGKYDQDFSNYNKETQTNGLLALLIHRNYNRLYENFMVQVGNNIDITNGFSTQVMFSFYDRSRLDNSTNFSFFNRSAQYAPNVPENEYVPADYTLHTATIASVSLSYTPKYFYRMRGRQKRMAYSTYPTFSLTWREGIPSLFGSKSDFSFAKISISQNVRMGLMEELSYQVEAANFFRSKEVDFPDFYHFMMPGYVVHTADETSWEYSRYYRYSTPTWGVSGRVRYATPYLALKYLPLLDRTYCRETVRGQVLYTPQNEFYSELGYEMSEIFLIFRLGVFVGFENTSFRLVGVNFGFNL